MEEKTSYERSNERKKKRYREDPEFRERCLRMQREWRLRQPKKPKPIVDRTKNKTYDKKAYDRQYFLDHKEQIYANRARRVARKKMLAMC